MEEDAVNSETISRYINRLEKWSEDKAPTATALMNLQREIPLTGAEKDRVDSLAGNYAFRARAALSSNAYNQAIIEMTKAVKLKPRNSSYRLELAHIYLQRSLERGYKRDDRRRAMKIAKAALMQNPADNRAKSFLQNYRRMNSDFSAIRNRKYILPAILLVGIAGTIAVWQRDNIPKTTVKSDSGALQPAKSNLSETRREVDIVINGFDGGNWEMEILQAELGRRNDDSFVKILGTLRTSDEYVEEMQLLVRGKDASGNTQFTIPWTVLDNDSPLMFPGDSTPLMLFRRLADSEILIDKLEIVPFELEFLQEKPNWDGKKPILVWNTPRPENVSINAEIRRFEVIEAYDRLILAMDLVLTNSGILDISRLSINISLGPDLPSFSHDPVKTENPAMSRGERRVWKLAIGFPLDAILAEREVTIRITEARS